LVDLNLVADLGINDAELDTEVGTMFDGLDELMQQTVRPPAAPAPSGDGAAGKSPAKDKFAPNSILTGRVVNVVGDDFVVDVGYKSEGLIPKAEFENPDEVDIGDEVQVLLESVETESGLIQLSKRRADRELVWRDLMKTKKEGDVVKGKVERKIKGGLLINIGIPVFLPASQVDVRRPADIGIYIGKEIDCEILKIDEERRNIVVSRRKLIERLREEAKRNLLNEIKEGEVRKGIVKNIADFGAFVDLGGIDGLLHITDMSWGRVKDPHERVKINQEIEVKILKVDREKEKIALGLKQISASPWEEVETKYPVGTRIKGEVVNIVSYGAFVKLEEGIEGLVHISEMSWTRRINHPSEVVSVGDQIDVVVLEVNKDKQEISLGMKQAEVNPWTLVAEKYPPGTVIEGKVRNLTNYGAFIELEEGIDGLLHVSDMSWTKKVSHPNELLKKGQVVRAIVLSVDEEKQRIALGLKQLTEDPWERAIPERYIPGQIVKGKVTKMTNFGVFVELEPGLEGLLHVSELADHKVEDPKEVVDIGKEVDVKILRVDSEDRKIGLSLKRAQWAAEKEAAAAADEAEGRKKPVRRGGLGGATISLGAGGEEAPPQA
jgi:small subunit ribosomal protein S1